MHTEHNTPDKKEEIIVNEILEKIRGYFGFVPKIFEGLSKKPPALKTYFEKLKTMMVDDSLPPSTKEFISIGAASALGAENCLATHLEVARSFGASDDQLLLAIIIGASIAETAALAKSLRVYEKFKG
jgi:AhpD family alkylhydroperoxidase